MPNSFKPRIKLFYYGGTINVDLLVPNMDRYKMVTEIKAQFLKSAQGKHDL